MQYCVYIPRIHHELIRSIKTKKKTNVKTSFNDIWQIKFTKIKKYIYYLKIFWKKNPILKKKIFLFFLSTIYLKFFSFFLALMSTNQFIRSHILTLNFNFCATRQSKLTEKQKSRNKCSKIKIKKSKIYKV